MIGSSLLGHAFALPEKVFGKCESEIKLMFVGNHKDCYEFCANYNWSYMDKQKEWRLSISPHI